MKKYLLILSFLPAFAFAGGPKYTYKTPQGLDDEMNNLYHDIKNPIINVGTASTMTITNLSVSTMTASSATLALVNISTLAINGVPQINSCGYIIGTVIQTLRTADTSATTSSGTSYTTTTTAATLTPKCASDRVNIWVAGTLNSTAFTTSSSYLSIFSDTTDLEGTGNGFVLISGNATNTVSQEPSSAIYSAGVASISARTYSAKIKSDTAGKATWNGNGTGTIIVQEVAN